MFQFLKEMKSRIAVRIREAASDAVFVLPRAKSVLMDHCAEGYVDTAVKILMAVVIGALVLAGLYTLFGETVLPTLTQRIKDMFNYGG